ncbi:MAG: HDOD domain-containing protein [bacterium]
MSSPATNAKHVAQAPGERSPGVGGKRLAKAFEKVSRMPALDESRRRLIRITEGQGSSPGDISEAVESDAALAIAVMRAANNGDGPSARVGGVREAVDALSPAEIRTIAGRVDTYDTFDAAGMRPAAQERFRRHAVATRYAADRVAEAAHLGQRDELAVAALLHDVGRLVVVELYGEEFAFRKECPDERLRREHRELGIDHALVGAVLVRRWGLKPAISTTVERHHSPEAGGHAAAVRLADAIVHHAAGDPVSADVLVSAAGRLDLDTVALRALVYEFPHAGTTKRRSTDPCPLSQREVEALRGLSEGKVYKQIARELNLSVSTIRTHLHNVYRKIGVVDRAQAVLLSRDRGWI